MAARGTIQTVWATNDYGAETLGTGLCLNLAEVMVVLFLWWDGGKWVIGNLGAGAAITNKP